MKEKLNTIRVGLTDADLKPLREIALFNDESLSTTIRKIIRRHRQDILNGAELLRKTHKRELP